VIKPGADGPCHHDPVSTKGGGSSRLLPPAACVPWSLRNHLDSSVRTPERDVRVPIPAVEDGVGPVGGVVEVEALGHEEQAEVLHLEQRQVLQLPPHTKRKI
jgi:hypothetical protein